MAEKIVYNIIKINRGVVREVILPKKKDVIRNRIVTKTVNSSKDEFYKNKRILHSIMNNGFKKVNECNKTVTIIVGRKGEGKTTISNLFHGTDLICHKGTGTSDDETKSLSEPIKSIKVPGLYVIDSVGFFPTLSNIGKLILLLMSLGIFPDYILFPIPNHRAVDLLPLNEFIKVGLVKIMLVPFSATSYYSNIKVCMEKQGKTSEESKAMAIENSFHHDISNDLKTFIFASGWQGNVVPVQSFDSVPTINGSMRVNFLSKFFKGGRFIGLEYQNYKSNLVLNQDDPRKTHAMLYGLLIDAVKSIPAHGALNTRTNLIESINECSFLRD